MFRNHFRISLAMSSLATLLLISSCGSSGSSSLSSSSSSAGYNVAYTLPTAETSPTAEPTAPLPATGVTAIVDSYATDKANNVAGVRVLTAFSNLYTPGANLDTGTIKIPTVMSYNNKYVVELTTQRTLEQEIAAYYDDRRNQSYSVIDGLGPLATYYYTGADATTTIPTFDATTLADTYYSDAGTASYGGTSTSSLNDLYALILDVRSFSTTPAKKAYSYPRPFRLNTSGVFSDTGTYNTINVDTVSTTVSGTTVTNTDSWADENFEIYNSSVVVAPSLVVAESITPLSDYGFPSGHTNAAYSTALALGYAIPERYQELLTRASELGTNRILAGMHSPLDVMGGRMMATAWSAAILYNNDMTGCTSPN